MGEIRPKECEPRELTKDQLAGPVARAEALQADPAREDGGVHPPSCAPGSAGAQARPCGTAGGGGSAAAADCGAAAAGSVGSAAALRGAGSALGAVAGDERERRRTGIVSTSSVVFLQKEFG